MRRVQESVRNLEEVLTSQQIEAESEKSRIETREKVILRTRANRALTGDLFLLFFIKRKFELHVRICILGSQSNICQAKYEVQFSART